jgi:hypothetical protein
MNERIQELADRLWRIHPKDIDAMGLKTRKEFYEQELKKFAELLIRECITQCENVGEIAEQTNHGEMARKTKATSNGCAQMIKWRFGLE